MATEKDKPKNIREYVKSYNKYFDYQVYKEHATRKKFMHMKKNFEQREKSMELEIKKAYAQRANSLVRNDSQKNCQALEQLLNNYLKSINSNSEEYDKVITALLKRTDSIDSYLNNLRPEDMKVSKHLALSTKKDVENYEKAYDNVKKEYERAGKDLTIINKDPRVKPLFDKLQNSYRSYNKAKGLLFESFIQVAGSYLEYAVSNTLFDNMDDLYKAITQTILNEKSPIKTAGSGTRDVRINLSDEKMTLGTVQQKVDVVLKNPFGYNDLNITAKNYQGTRDIHLLDSANIINLISGWEEVSNLTKQYYASALTYYTPQPKEIFLAAGHRMFAAQALAGIGTRGANKETLAEYVVVNRRNKELGETIKVVSTASILNFAIAGKSFADAFDVKVTNHKGKLAPLFTEKEALVQDKEGNWTGTRTLTEIQERVAKTHVQVMLKMSFFNSIKN